MSTLPYLDIHGHGRLAVENSITVGSLSVEEITTLKTAGDHSTAGIHPWWLEEYTFEEIEKMKLQVEKMLEEKKLWGVGETGLDRSMPELMERQKELFLWHLELAEKYRLPLVIHNVKSGSDFLEILKSRKPRQSWIFHDYRGGEQLMQDLLRLHSDCFFSFGLSIDNSPTIRELLPKVPLQNIFFETDDQKHLDIHDIYLRASHQLDIELEFLKSQILYNFKKVSASHV